MTITTGPAATDEQQHGGGLRIFIGTGNLGNALPSQCGISSWIPRNGRVHDILRQGQRALVDRKEADWTGVPRDGQFEVIVLGMQEGTPGSNAFVASGVTAGLTKNSKERRLDGKDASKDASKDNGEKKGPGKLARKVKSPLKKLHKMSRSLEDIVLPVNEVMDAMENAMWDAVDGGTQDLRDLLQNQLGKDNYALLSNFQRGEMILFVFVHQSLAPLCSIKVTAENTGLANVMANKGGIAAILTVNTTRIAFLSMHLEPHEGIKRYEKRNADIAEILQGTKDPTLAVHHAFILGDLNYRVAFYRHSKDEELSKEEEMSLSQKLIAREDWISMNCYDELSRALREKKCLVGFQTPLCDFPPTFKIERRKGFVYDWKRIPSYTDRILWKSIEETRSIQALIYEPIADFETSDHKPMRGIFFLPKRRPLCANPQRPILNLRLQRLQCKNLRPGKNLLLNDIHTFLKFYCEPSHLMMQPENNKANLRTSTVKSSNCPQWPEKEFHFKFYVYPEQTFVGAYLFVYSMADIKLIGDSKIGTAILDLEYFATNCKDGGHKRISLQKILLRSGKEAGNFSCDLLVWWSKE